MTSISRSRSSKKGPASRRIPFPQRVFHLLQLAEEHEWEDIISWVDNGTRFRVHDRQKFEKILLQKYFNATRYASFTRQLHAYGFDCVRTGRQTGIYSHPNFTRDNPKVSCALPTTASKSDSAIKNMLSEASYNQNEVQAGVQAASFQQGIRAGDTIVQFPSLLRRIHDDEMSSGSSTNESNDSNSHPSPLVASLYNTVSSRIAEQTRRALIRIPPQSISENHPFDNTDNGPNNAFWSLGPATQFRTVGDVAASPHQQMQQQQQNQQSPSPTANMNTNTNDILDFEPTPITEENGNDDVLQFDDLEPIPWSPEQSLPDDESQGMSTMDYHHQPNDQQQQQPLDSNLLEPRPIEAMIQNPNDNTIVKAEWWYDSTPMFDTPRKRAMLEYSFPISLPVFFFYLDVSNYARYAVSFVILSHFVYCMLTAWGGVNDRTDRTYTKDFSLTPVFSMLQHHVLDLLFIHALLSDMILMPDKYGNQCFPLVYIFTLVQPINLSVVTKTHYCESNLFGTFAHEKYWIGCLIRKVILGYALAIYGVVLMDFFDMRYLRIPLVFGFNMIPLYTFESYRYLIAIRAMLATGVSDAKKVN